MIPVLSLRLGATSTDYTAFQQWMQLASMEHMWYDKIVEQGRALRERTYQDAVASTTKEPGQDAKRTL